MHRSKTQAALLLALLLLSALQLQAQSTGSWKAFPSFYNVTRMEEGGGKVWVLASGNLMSHDTQTGETSVYTKGSPLSDATIADIGWNATARRLLVVYANGNMDLLSADGTAANLSDYYNKSLTYDKTVHAIVMDGRNAYLATAFGIVKVNMQRAEIDDTYTLGTAVHDILVEGHTLYAATDKGLLRASDADNLLQADSWKVLNASPWTAVARLDGTLWAAAQGNVSAIDTRTGQATERWQPYYTRTQRTAGRLIFYGSGTRAFFLNADKSINSVGYDNCYAWRYNEADGTWWAGTDNGQALHLSFGTDGTVTVLAGNIIPNSPHSNHFGNMKMTGSTLITVPGIGSDNRPGTVQLWDGSTWTFFDESFVPALGHRYRGLTDMAADPTDPARVIVSGSCGVYEFRNGQLQRSWNLDNSPLQPAVTVTKNNPASVWPDYTCVYTVAVDAQGTLWCANSISPSTSLLSMDKDGNWTAHPHSELMVSVDGSLRSMDAMYGMMFDSRSLLWFTNKDYRRPALVAYRTGTDALKAYTTFINEDLATVDVSEVRCVAEDLDHSLWIGTNAGPLQLPAADISNNDPNAAAIFNQVKVPRNDGTNLADYLLADVAVKCIAVDGAGRKWMGTDNNGLYLISADNMTQLLHFTAENSPLPSNDVESVAVNGTTGEVFVGTAAGLCSYMGDASLPAETMTKDNVYAYPNPVRPGFSGRVTVVGLTLNADVKIVTASGTLVAEGRSNGGTFTWDLADLKGRRVASGVYMVQTATADGGKGTVCKIAVVN